MSKITATELPSQSQLNNRVGSTDFIDCYCVESDLPPRKAAEIITEFPIWVNFLLRIRALMTRPFGLINDSIATDKLGIFPVEAENSQELIAGFNDKHLDFRISVLSQNGRVFLATWVHTHNIGGRIYLKAILPFHILISRNGLARVHAADSS